MSEIIIILILGACIAWPIWTVRKYKQALKEAALDEAWREVLKDPHYIDRRRHEERRLVNEARGNAANR